GLTDDRYAATYWVGRSGPWFIPRDTLSGSSFRTQAVRDIVADPTRPGYLYAVESVQVLTTSGTVIDAGEITFSRSTDFGLTWNDMFTVGSDPGNLNELPANLQFRYRSVLNDDDATRFVRFDRTLHDHV